MNESQRTGSLKAEKEKRFLEKYGVKNPFQSEIVKTKIKETSLKHYGVDNPAKSDDVKEQSRLVCQEKYGADFALCRGTSVRERVERTNEEKYGGRSAFSSESTRKKAKETLIEKYGEDCIFKTQGYYDDVKKTLLERYGVVNAFSLPNSIEAAHTDEANKKRFETLRKNGSMKSSKIEDSIASLIEQTYGDIDRHCIVNGWSIDLFVHSLQVYVQVDGIYWHGLNRPIEIIEQSTTAMDSAILRKYRRDRDQDVWFSQNGLKLVRIIDVEWLRVTDKSDYLQSKLGDPV